MKRWKNIAGSAFALLVMASVLFLYGGDLRDVDFTNADLLPGLAGATGLYVIVILTGAFGWRVILTAFRKSQKVKKSIVVPEYVSDIAKVQIWCAFAETNLGEAAFDHPVK